MFKYIELMPDEVCIPLNAITVFTFSNKSKDVELCFLSGEQLIYGNMGDNKQYRPILKSIHLKGVGESFKSFLGSEQRDVFFVDAAIEEENELPF